MNGFQLESDVTVNPDCVTPIEGEVVKMLFRFQFLCAAHSCKLPLACGVRSVQNIRELGWRNLCRLLYSWSSSSGDR